MSYTYNYNWDIDDPKNGNYNPNEANYHCDGRLNEYNNTHGLSVNAYGKSYAKTPSNVRKIRLAAIITNPK